MPPFVVLSHGRVVSRYPVAPALLILPLMAPQIALLDWRQPGWDRNPARAMKACRRMAKWSVSVLMVLAAVIFHRFLLRLGLGRRSPARRRGRVSGLGPLDAREPGSLAARSGGPGADRGPGAVAPRTSLAMAAGAGRGSPRPSYLLRTSAGLALRGGDRRLDRPDPASAPGLVPARAHRRSRVAARLQLLVLRDPHRRPGAARGSCTLELHGVTGTWSGSLAEGAAGTLFSPNRGLFIF